MHAKFQFAIGWQFHGCVALWRMPAPVTLRAETPESAVESIGHRIAPQAGRNAIILSGFGRNADVRE